MGLGAQAVTARAVAVEGDARPGSPAASASVSVVVPVRNRAALLERTLDALSRQTLRDHEVVVVDDGSTDGSADVAERRAAGDARVRVVHAGGAGAVAARRLGVAAATAEFLAFTDSDCVPDPEWLEAGVARLRAGADVVQGATRPTTRARALERSVWSTVDDGLFATCNVFYRRDAYEVAGGFDDAAGERLGFRPGSALRGLGFGEDTLLGWRVRRSGSAVFAPEARVAHHVFPVDVRDTVRRSWTAGGFPALVREVPELRSLLRDDLARGRRGRMPLYAAAAAAVARQRGLAMACAGVWLASRAVAVAKDEPSWRRRVKVLPLDVLSEAVTAAALVSGSVRARTLLV